MSGKKTEAIRVYFTEEEMSRIREIVKADDFGEQVGPWIAWKIRRLLRESQRQDR